MEAEMMETSLEAGAVAIATNSGRPANVSFGFSKKNDKKILQQSTIVEHEQEAAEEAAGEDFVTSVDAQGRVKGTKPEVKKKEYIVPLIRQNRWRRTDTSGTEIDKLAISEILDDVKRQNEEWEGREEGDYKGFTVPLLLQNKAPDGTETDDKIDLSIRPDGSELDDYTDMPVEAFGMAMLRGMGWSETEGIGRTFKQHVTPIDTVLRPKGLGLGANKRQASDLDDNKHKKHKTSSRGVTEGEVLVKGCLVLAVGGSYKHSYGEVEGLDDDSGRLFIKLALKGERVSINELLLKKVDRSEYKKYARDVSQFSKANTAPSSKKPSDNGEEQKKPTPRVQKHSTGSAKVKNSPNTGSAEVKHWVVPHLRVRFIDKTYKNGRYYNKKLMIIDIPSRSHCMCQTDDGKILEDLHESMLETVIPRSDGAVVMVVAGKLRGSLGEIVKRDKSKCQAVVRLFDRNISDVVEMFSYDCICEYLPKTHPHSK